MIDLTKTDRSFLLYLALHGPSIGNRMKPEIKNASRIAKSLKRKGMIEGECTGVLVRPVDILSLTVLGLSFALGRTKPEEHRAIIERWSDLIPLVSEKWSLFIKEGVEDLALRKIAIASSRVFNGFFPYPMELDLARDFIEVFSHTPRDLSMDFAEMFSHYFYDPHIEFFTREESSRWAKVCKKDRELHSYLSASLIVSMRKHDIMRYKGKAMLEVLGDEADSLSTLFLTPG